MILSYHIDSQYIINIYLRIDHFSGVVSSQHLVTYPQRGDVSLALRRAHARLTGEAARAHTH